MNSSIVVSESGEATVRNSIMCQKPAVVTAADLLLSLSKHKEK